MEQTSGGIVEQPNFLSYGASNLFLQCPEFALIMFMWVAACFAHDQGQLQLGHNPGVNTTGVSPGQGTQTLTENKLLETSLLKKSRSEGVMVSFKACVANHPLFEVWTLLTLV